MCLLAIYNSFSENCLFIFLAHFLYFSIIVLQYILYYIKYILFYCFSYNLYIYIVFLLLLLFIYSENFQFYVDPNVAFNIKILSRRETMPSLLGVIKQHTPGVSQTSRPSVVPVQLQSHSRNWKIIRNLGSGFLQSPSLHASCSRRVNRQLPGKSPLPEQQNYYDKSRVMWTGTKDYFTSVIPCHRLSSSSSVEHVQESCLHVRGGRRMVLSWIFITDFSKGSFMLFTCLSGAIVRWRTQSLHV